MRMKLRGTAVQVQGLGRTAVAPVLPTPPYSQQSVRSAPAACCRLNSRGERIFSEECGSTSLKCSKGTGICASTVCASRRPMCAT